MFYNNDTVIHKIICTARQTCQLRFVPTNAKLTNSLPQPIIIHHHIVYTKHDQNTLKHIHDTFICIFFSFLFEHKYHMPIICKKFLQKSPQFSGCFGLSEIIKTLNSFWHLKRKMFNKFCVG